jgi:hypothetical protein
MQHSAGEHRLVPHCVRPRPARLPTLVDAHSSFDGRREEAVRSDTVALAHGRPHR